MALKNNTWKLNQWYDQSVAGTVSYSGLNLLWGWGDNENGGLGLNSTNAGYSSPIQVSDATTWKFPPSGASHTAETSVLVKTDGTLWSWGYNTYGMLGQNSVVHISSPTQIPGTTWNTAIMGRNNTMATKTDGTLWTWGNNYRGVFGTNQAHNIKVSSPVQVPGTTWDKIYSSNTAVFAIKTDNTLWSWGMNSYAGLGHNNNTNYSSPTQVPGTTWARVGSGDEYGTMATKTDGTLWAWGGNGSGALGQNNTTWYSSPKQIPGTTWDYTADYKMACGANARWAIKTDGTLWSWGYNNQGALGQNNTTQYSSPIQVPGTTWNIVSSSYADEIMAIKTDGAMWNWGRSGYTGGPIFEGQAFPSMRSSPVQLPGTWANVLDTRRLTFAEKVI